MSPMMLLSLFALCAVTANSAPITAAAPVLQTARFGVDMVQCDGVSEPQVPTGVPGWAAKSADALRNDGSVRQLSGSNAFARGSEVVIKECSLSALKAAIDHVQPDFGGNKDPTFDIYFDCGSGSMYVITVDGELEFGNGSSDTGGTYRLMAPKFNVELNGDRRHRIMRVNKNTQLTVFGLQFREGARVNLSWTLSDVPSGGWNGGAILAAFSSRVVVYKCEFHDNVASARYVRWGSGGAIMAETDSHLLVWDSNFEGNQGSGGGAIAGSSATTVYIAHSTFRGNVARGGFDTTKKVNIGGSQKSVIGIRGGFMRIDSVAGHSSSDHHVIVCNSDIRDNKIMFTSQDLADFGYKQSEAEHLRANAAAFSVWNRDNKLDGNSDRNLLDVHGCVFDGNYEDLPWSGFRMGMFVFAAEGEGHMSITDIVFSNNRVQEAVVRFDNSDRFYTYDFWLTLRNIDFVNNGGIRNVRFHDPKHDSRCRVDNVDGLKNGSGHCNDLL